MSRTSKIVSVIVAVIVVIACVYFTSHKTQKVYGSTVPSTSTAIYGTESIGGPLFLLGGAATGPNVGTSIAEQPSTGSCNSGAYAASSTLFAIANPFAASSTAVLQIITGTGNATTSTLLVGTSTASTGLTSSTISPTFVNTNISTSTRFDVMSGIQVGDVGYVTPGVSSYRTIEVGPSNFVSAYATSTAVGSGAAGYVPGLTCTYKLRWTN